MSNSNLPVKYTGVVINETLPDDFLVELAEEKRRFIQYVHDHIKTKSGRMMAIEAGAHYFSGQYLNRIQEGYLMALEECARRKLKLNELFRKQRLSLAADWQQLEVMIAQGDFQKAKLTHSTRKFLQPPGHEELERVFAAEKIELVKTRLRRTRERYLLQAAMSDAGERARLRADFVAQIGSEYDDPAVVEEAIDEYNRTMLRQEDEP